jgi:hypothetical protein
MTTQTDTHKTVIDFFVSRGYLYAENFDRVKSIKLSEAFAVGREEPRVFAVLPAALLRSTKCVILDMEIPPDLYATLGALKKDLVDGPDFMGVPYSEVRRWANLKINDSRSKPQNEKKITKSFRFSLRTLRLLKEKAKEMGVTETKVLEDLITAFR